jgi:hypothetical protein
MAHGEPRWKVVRDWLSFALAIVALAVSATNSYVTGLRELSELRAVIGHLPFIVYDDQIKRFKVIGNRSSVLFINAGNRPISVIGASIIFGEPTVVNGRNECDGITLATDFSFTVIDEKKIVEKEVKVDIPSWILGGDFPDFRKEEDGRISFVAPDLLKKGTASGCIEFQIVTTRELERSTVEGHRQTFSEAHFDVRRTYEKASPVLLYRGWNWSFW